MNKLALATYQFEMNQNESAFSTLDSSQQTLLQPILGLFKTPAQTIAKIIIDDDPLSDWSVL